MATFKDMIKNQFHRVEGGTALGNLARSVVKNYTGGLLGNGQFMLGKGQTIEDRKQLDKAQMSAGVGGAVAGFSTGAGAGVVGSDNLDNVYQGGKTAAMGKLWSWFKTTTGKIVWMSVTGIILFVVIWKMAKKNKHSVKRKY